MVCVAHLLCSVPVLIVAMKPPLPFIAIWQAVLTQPLGEYFQVPNTISDADHICHAPLLFHACNALDGHATSILSDKTRQQANAALCLGTPVHQQ